MVAAAVLNLFLIANLKSRPNSVQYLNPQLSCRNMMRFKMAGMLDCGKPDY